MAEIANPSNIEKIHCCHLIEKLQKAYVNEDEDTLYGCLVFEIATKVDEISKSIFNNKEITRIGIKESNWAIEQLKKDGLVGIGFKRHKDEKLYTAEALIQTMVKHIGAYMNVSQCERMGLKIIHLQVE